MAFPLIFLKVQDEFLFLHNSSMETFMRNWPKVEENVVDYVKTIRNRSQISQVLNNLEKAKEMFGKTSLYHSIMLCNLCLR